ncbi:MAG TPA: VOC family protein [Bryobacteraceae bacterium]|nr:VOC family protein [Bryobacteraceae bacterium]
MAIIGIAEIVLNVGDLPIMRDFYQQILGFQIHSQACYESGSVPDQSGDPTIAFLTIQSVDTPLGKHGHGQLLALIDFRRHVFVRDPLRVRKPTPSTLNHLAFEIPPESYSSEKDRLEKLGLNPTEVTFPAMTAQALFFHDPEQNLLELICDAPANG